ncbi:type II toxin-antitoxin system PemK/MazF family toxin [Solihabitans fulvus]|uniref:type II toxin-antitoxin system PemK/MazF family toxin n=1 Tax=Solihabitans fulvus TaxID=1892852 RepID=UPI001661D634|nr:type II toxin-antitoxin system PemK/MazF family toxin [Solihabitans fulvus]
MTVRIEPWQVWRVDLEPVAGREQGKARPAVVVSSAFHLRLVRGELLSVLPLTSVERRGWLHRVEISLPGHKTGWAITEQVRTLSAARLVGTEPVGKLDDDQLAAVRSVLARMLDV